MHIWPDLMKRSLASKKRWGDGIVSKACVNRAQIVQRTFKEPELRTKLLNFDIVIYDAGSFLLSLSVTCVRVLP